MWVKAETNSYFFLNLNDRTAPTVSAGYLRLADRFAVFAPVWPQSSPVIGWHLTGSADLNLSSYHCEFRYTRYRAGMRSRDIYGRLRLRLRLRIKLFGGSGSGSGSGQNVPAPAAPAPAPMLSPHMGLKGTNPTLKKSSNIPEIYAKMFGRCH